MTDQRTLDALLERTTHVVVADHAGVVLSRADSPKDLTALRSALRLHLDGVWSHCMCNGGDRIILYARKRVLGVISETEHHGVSVRMSFLRSDPKLLDGGAAWRAWLKHHGAPRAQASWRKGERRRKAEAQERWLALMPAALRPFWERARDDDPTLTLRELTAAHEREVPDPAERVRQLFVWYGRDGSWSSAPEYEEQAAALLRQYPTHQLVARLEFTADQLVLSGAARFFSSSAFEEHDALPQPTRQRLLRHVRVHRPQDVERTTGAFPLAPGRATQARLDALLAKTTRFEVVDEEGRVTARRRSRPELEALRAAARVVEPRVPRCVCAANGTVRLFSGQRLLGELRTQHGNVLQVPGANDAELANEGADWRAWLAARGVTASNQGSRRQDTHDQLADAWRGAMPPALLPTWEATLAASCRGNLPRLRQAQTEAFTRAVPERADRIRQLLRWFGATRQWTHFPAYEQQAEALLFDFTTPELARVAEASEDQRVHEGAARFFAGAAFERRRPQDRALLTPPLRTKLLNHIRRGPDLEKLARAEKRLGPAPWDPARALEVLESRRATELRPVQIRALLAGLEPLTNWAAVFMREAVRLRKTDLVTAWRDALTLLEKTKTHVPLAIRPAWKLAAMQAATVADEPPVAVRLALAREGGDASRDALLLDFERASSLEPDRINWRAFELRRSGQGIALCEALYWKYVERYGPHIGLMPWEARGGRGPSFHLQRRPDTD